MIAYKILRKKENQLTSCFIVSDKIKIIYEVNKIIFPSIKNSLILVFKELENALSFYKNLPLRYSLTDTLSFKKDLGTAYIYEMWQVEIDGENDLPWYRLSTDIHNQDENFIEFWMKKNYFYAHEAWPQGTIGAKWIKLLNKIY